MDCWMVNNVKCTPFWLEHFEEQVLAGQRNRNTVVKSCVEAGQVIMDPTLDTLGSKRAMSHGLDRWVWE